MASHMAFNALRKFMGFENDLGVEVLSLFGVVSDHVFENVSDENLPLLSYIRKAGIDGDMTGPNMDDVNKALYAIESYFRRNPSILDHERYRRRICSKFAHHLLLENYEQLVQNYNRVMANVREYFPDFNLVQRGHNAVFGEDAMVPCLAKRCSDEEMETWLQKEESFFTISEHGKTGNSSDDKARSLLKSELQTFYADDSYDNGVGPRADFLEKVLPKLRSFPYGMEYMLNYKYYICSGNYEQINDFLRGRSRPHRPRRSMEDLAPYFTMFAANLVLPFITTKDIVVYRGDLEKSSTRTLDVKGFLSTALTVRDTEKFAKNGGRILSIKIPKGTPIIPLSLYVSFECEVALLPGTRLARLSEMKFSKGLFVEYKVLSNPPQLTAVDEATLFRNQIAQGYRLFEDTHFKDCKPATGLPTAKEMYDFNVQLVKKMY